MDTIIKKMETTFMNTLNSKTNESNKFIKKMETIFMNTLNSKTNESDKFIYQFNDKLNFKNPNKNMALANLKIYYTRRNIKSEYNNNKFKISVRT